MLFGLIGHDADGIDFLQQPPDVSHVVVGHAVEASVLPVGQQVAALPLRHGIGQLKEGLEVGQGAVAVGLELMVAFVDGKVVVGNERVVQPGAALLIGIAELVLPGQHEDAQCEAAHYGHDECRGGAAHGGGGWVMNNV